MNACPFCDIIAWKAHANVVRLWNDAVAFTPLNPVTPGHILVVPAQHVEDFTTNPEVTALTMHRVAELATRPCNLITSAGAEATQTVHHLHVHIVPRSVGDGLRLPWTVG